MWKCVENANGKLGLPKWLRGKESVCQWRRYKRFSFNPWVGKIPWRRKWQPTPVFLPGASQGQRSLAGGHKESDTTEHTHTHTTGSYFFLLLSSSPSCESSKTCPSWPRSTTNRRLCSVGRSPHPISSRLLPLRLPLCFALASLTSCPSAGILPFTHWTRAFGLSGWAELSEIPFKNLLPGLWPKNFTVGLSFIQHSIRLYWESTMNRERWTGKQVRSHSLFKI